MQETENFVLNIFSVKKLLKLQLLHFTENFTSKINRWATPQRNVCYLTCACI